MMMMMIEIIDMMIEMMETDHGDYMMRMEMSLIHKANFVSSLIYFFVCFILTYECYPMISAPMNDDRSCYHHNVFVLLF